MTISIITPVFNSEKTIIKNVKSIIGQTIHDFEHIIVDNLSGDNSLKIIRYEYKKAGMTEKLRIISEKDSGISDAFNKGILTAKGEIIAILNGDDYYYNNTVFEKVLGAFKKHDILFTHGNIYFEDDLYGSNIRRPLMCSIRKSGPYNHPTMFIRKEVYQKYGMYDTQFRTSMDMELICRLTSKIEKFDKKGFYIDGEPIVFMSSGGVSWVNEFNVVKEEKRAVKMHGFWNFEAFVAYTMRGLRVRLKYVLRKLHLKGLIKIWRSYKWE